MQIGARTKLFAVLGHPVAHSLSPAMHNAALARLGMDAVYVAFDIEPGRLPAALPVLRDLGVAGVNLTVPLKEVAFGVLSELDEWARLARAVNTIKFDGDTMRGFNTDAPGFLRTLREEFGADVRGRSVCILGTGGSARGIAIACLRSGARTLTLAGRTAAKIEALAAGLDGIRGAASLATVDQAGDGWAGACRAADVVVHTTTVGMKPGDAEIVRPDYFRAGQIAYDLIYVTRETPFTRAARAGGARAANGLGMLLHQGAQALEIWTGRDAPVDAMRDALESAVYSRATVSPPSTIRT
jgi:shikimate dehydrogenase